MTIDYLLSDATFESDEISIYDVNTQIEKTDTVENIRYDFGYYEITGIDFGEIPICIDVEYIE